MRERLALFAIALGVRLALLAAWYTPGLESFDKGDFASYVDGMEWFAVHGNFAHPSSFVRPPALPLLAYALGGDRLAVLLANALLGAAVAPIAHAIALRVGLSQHAAFAAGVVTALDPGTIRYSVFLGPEALANASLALALLVLVDALRDPGAAFGRAVLAGGVLTLSTLTRPGPFLLAPVLAVTGLVLRPRKPAMLVVFALVALAGSGAWILHNFVTFGRASISSVGPYTLLYYRAASLEHLSSGRPIDDVYLDLAARVERRIGGDPGAVTPETREQRHLYGGAATSAAMLEIATEVIRQHPLLYVATLPLGAARMFGLVTPNVTMPSFFEALAILWNAALFVACAVGLRASWRERPHLVWLGAVVILYFTAITLLVETSAIDTRMRSMMTPLMAIAAVAAFSRRL